MWLDQFSLNYSDDRFHRILNSIELSLVGWVSFVADLMSVNITPYVFLLTLHVMVPDHKQGLLTGTLVIIILKMANTDFS